MNTKLHKACNPRARDTMSSPSLETGPITLTMQRDEATLRTKGGIYAVGATQAEIREGRTCVGLYNGKAEMPEGVAGEQFSEACCGSKVEDSARVVELLAKKGAESDYKLFQTDLRKTVNCLCSDRGWTEENVVKVVDEHQTAFNAKGIQVKFHLSTHGKDADQIKKSKER